MTIWKYWKPIAAVASGLIVLAGATTAYNTIRPYATRSELAKVEQTAKTDLAEVDRTVREKYAQVNQRSCDNRLSFLSRELRDVDRRISDAEKENNRNWLRTLQEQKADILAEIARTKRECNWN